MINKMMENIQIDWDRVCEYVGKRVVLRVRWEEPWVDWVTGSAWDGTEYTGYPRTKPPHITVSVPRNSDWYYKKNGRIEVRELMAHELIHLTGLRHGKEAKKIGYYSRPREKDILSNSLKEIIFNGSEINKKI